MATRSPRQRRQRSRPNAAEGRKTDQCGCAVGRTHVMRVRDGNNGKRVATYQITSEPRRLAAASGLCNLETGRKRSSLSPPATPRRAVEEFRRQGDFGEGRRDRLRPGRRADERGRGEKWSVVTKR